MFDLEKTNQNISDICDLIGRLNAPQPLNPAGLSDLTYGQIMAGMHDETWVRDFVTFVSGEVA